MKIAFVIPGGGGGGVRSIVRIATGLIEHRHRVRILYRDPPATARDRLRRMYLGIRYGQRNRWLTRFPGIATPYRRLEAHCVGRNDVLIGVGVSCVLEISELPDRCGVKVHNSRGVEPWIPEVMQAAWQLKMPRIVVGSHLVELMRRAGSMDPIFVAHNGVDRSEYFPCVDSDQRNGVGAVFHGGSVKDPAMLLEVFRRLSIARPQTPLHCFGSFPRPRQLPTRVDYVRFPSLAQAREIYSRCSVWFLTSQNEGLPNPLLEALACGCAVVSTDCGGASDIVAHDYNGFLIPVGDANSMIGSILRLLDCPATRSRFAAAGAGVLQRFTWPGAVATFEAAVENVRSSIRPAAFEPDAELSYALP